MRFYKPQKGATLPSLTEPATEQDIVLGTQAINKNGKKLEGKLYIGQVHTQGGASIALVTDDEAGVSNPRRALVLAKSIGNATAADILQGKTALTDAGEVTGTLEVTGGEPSYTLQVASGEQGDSLKYSLPNSSEPRLTILNTSYQDITCGGILSFYSHTNPPDSVKCKNANGTTMLSIDPSSKYLFGLMGLNSWYTINIGAIMRDYPLTSKIYIEYTS